MRNKATKYGLMTIATLLLIAMVCAGAASAVVYEINNSSDWKTYMTGNHDCVLVNDIDFGGESAFISSFSGTLDGYYNGEYHSISNFSAYFDAPAGLIGLYGGNMISNLTISNFYVTGGAYVAGLVGRVSDTCSIKNVNVVDGVVKGSRDVAGGIVGYAIGKEVRFENCVVKNCTISGGSSVGGLVGYSHKGDTIVDSCLVNCCRIAGNGNVGGMVGSAYSAGYEIELGNSEVVNCVVKSSSGYSGGCIGAEMLESNIFHDVDNCTVRNCAIYVTTNNGPCGGIIGGCQLNSNPTDYPSVSNCTVEFCTIAGECSVGTGASVGGIAGTFPVAGKLDRNKVISSCIVSKKGTAAGICPTAIATA